MTILWDNFDKDRTVCIVIFNYYQWLQDTRWSSRPSMKAHTTVCIREIPIVLNPYRIAINLVLRKSKQAIESQTVRIRLFYTFISGIKLLQNMVLYNIRVTPFNTAFYEGPTQIINSTKFSNCFIPLMTSY